MWTDEGNKPSRQDCEAAPLTNCTLRFHIGGPASRRDGPRLPTDQSRAPGSDLAGKRSVCGDCDSALTCGDDDDDDDGAGGGVWWRLVRSYRCF